MHLYEQLPVAVYAHDKEGKLVYYNPPAADLWGIRPSLDSLDWLSQWQADDLLGRPLSLADMSGFGAKGNRPGHAEKKEASIRLANGQTRRFLISPETLFDESGKPEGIVNTLVDITDGVVNHNMEAMLAAIVQSSGDAIISKTLDGVITSWNHTAELMFGYTAREAIGQHISIVIPDGLLHEQTELLSKVTAGETVENYESTRLRKGGAIIPVSLTISPIRNSGGKIIGASKSARDISKQKQLEEQQRRYTEKLKHEVDQRTRSLEKTLATLEKAKEEVTRAYEKERELNQLKSRFVSMASHEFRTPLAGIQLSVSLLERYTSSLDSDSVPKHLNKIRASVNLLTTILNEFLSLEKLESGKVDVFYKDIEIVPFLTELAEEMQWQARTGQHISYIHEEEISLVRLDETLLHNCLVNLVSNAIKYSGENTTIEIKSAIIGQECRLSVKDNGIGIPEEDQKHLFEAFFRAHNTGVIPGTGLGLNIVSRYVSLMKGRIEFESKAGQGSCFTLIFPNNYIPVGPDV